MTNTRTNARRGRPMVTLTLAPESVAEIDRRKGKLSRGAYVELLLETTLTPDEAEYEASMRNFAAQCGATPQRKAKR